MIKYIFKATVWPLFTSTAIISRQVMEGNTDETVRIATGCILEATDIAIVKTIRKLCTVQKPRWDTTCQEEGKKEPRISVDSIDSNYITFNHTKGHA